MLRRLLSWLLPPRLESPRLLLLRPLLPPLGLWLLCLLLPRPLLPQPLLPRPLPLGLSLAGRRCHGGAFDPALGGIKCWAATSTLKAKH